jgi:hypothetical protein
MTEREQLIAIRKDIILSKMEGNSQIEKDRATKDLHRMTFADHNDFLSYVEDSFGDGSGNKREPEATEEELDSIMGNIIPGYKGAGKTVETTSEMDELFKHLNI